MQCACLTIKSWKNYFWLHIRNPSPFSRCYFSITSWERAKKMDIQTAYIWLLVLCKPVLILYEYRCMCHESIIISDWLLDYFNDNQLEHDLGQHNGKAQTFFIVCVRVLIFWLLVLLYNELLWCNRCWIHLGVLHPIEIILVAKRLLFNNYLTMM